MTTTKSSHSSLLVSLVYCFMNENEVIKAKRSDLELFFNAAIFIIIHQNSIIIIITDNQSINGFYSWVKLFTSKSISSNLSIVWLWILNCVELRLPCLVHHNNHFTFVAFIPFDFHCIQHSILAIISRLNDWIYWYNYLDFPSR